jgi:NTP pyrophosphatase (non-canonical NTP hydrolase)
VDTRISATSQTRNQEDESPSVVDGPSKKNERPESGSETGSAQNSSSQLTWRQYSEWRKTKCPPQEIRAPIWLDELDQAIHEFVGECAELSAVVQQVGPWALEPASRERLKVRDEVGDVIFTGCWVMDCLDPAFFGQRGPVSNGFLTSREFHEKTAIDVIKATSRATLEDFSRAPEGTQRVVMAWIGDVKDALLEILTHAGQLSNRFKKLRYHRSMEGYHAQQQVESTFHAFVALDVLATLCGIGLEDAAMANMEKLDRRFPKGWVPGGGNR